MSWRDRLPNERRTFSGSTYRVHVYHDISSRVMRGENISSLDVRDTPPHIVEEET